LLAQFRDFPSIPGSGEIIPGYVERIPGYPGTGIRPQAIDFTVTFGGRPAVLAAVDENPGYIFPVERDGRYRMRGFADRRLRGGSGRGI
jgi:hypothetical protein